MLTAESSRKSFDVMEDYFFFRERERKWQWPDIALYNYCYSAVVIVILCRLSETTLT